MRLTCVLNEIIIISYVSYKMWKETPQNSWSNDSRTQFSRIRTFLDSSVTRRWRILVLVWVLYVLVCDRTIKSGSRVSSLTRIDLALETMHTCSILLKTAHTSQWNYLEEKRSKKETIPNQLSWKQTKLSYTGYTGAQAPVHPKATGCTGALSPV